MLMDVRQIVQLKQMDGSVRKEQLFLQLFVQKFAEMRLRQAEKIAMTETRLI